MIVFTLITACGGIKILQGVGDGSEIVQVIRNSELMHTLDFDNIPEELIIGLVEANYYLTADTLQYNSTDIVSSKHPLPNCLFEEALINKKAKVGIIMVYKGGYFEAKNCIVYHQVNSSEIRVAVYGVGIESNLSELDLSELTLDNIQSNFTIVHKAK